MKQTKRCKFCDKPVREENEKLECASCTKLNYNQRRRSEAMFKRAKLI